MQPAIYNLRGKVYNSTVNCETAVAQLSIVDGAWQESPDNLAIFDETGRGTLYLVVEVAGDPEGRDALARELIETARREYAATRGSITLALSQAVRAANDFFYTFNANTPREARRIAGMTAVVVRESDVFIAQAGPGLTCHVRGAELQRFPDESPWFISDEQPIYEDAFSTPGAVPLGARRDYTPDLFHVTLQPGDTILVSTRALAHLLTKEELLDTLARRHPDEIVESLEDLAGAADLSVIALQASPPSPRGERGEVALPTDEELARRRARAEQARLRRAQIAATFLGSAAGAMGALAGAFARINWTRLGAATERAISASLVGMARLIVRLIRLLLPGAPKEETRAPTTREPSGAQAGWRLAALIFPLLLIALGGAAWVNLRLEAQQIQIQQVNQSFQDANAWIEKGKSLSQTDKAAADEAFRQALSSARQAMEINPNHAGARSAFYQAQDLLDQLNGIAVLFSLPQFANYTDPQASPARIVSHYPDVFVLDRGTQRVYRYRVDEAGASAAPVAGDGVILKAGDKFDNRTVGELIDLIWVETGRLVAIDRSGAFWQYDPAKAGWSARVPIDASQWARVNLASSYLGNLYLLDPSRSQILKYVAPTEGAWSASVTYFAPGVTADLSKAVDLAIDSDVWVLRADGVILRFTAGKPADFAPRDLDLPLSKPAALFTNQTLLGLYVADAGNQRIVQLDKATGRFVRQFKPRGEARDTFNALKALAVDEANKKFFFINGNQAYLATLPQ